MAGLCHKGSFGLSDMHFYADAAESSQSPMEERTCNGDVTSRLEIKMTSRNEGFSLFESVNIMTGIA